ncbi:hypothetical protein [Solidesulfovibrio sp.]
MKTTALAARHNAPGILAALAGLWCLPSAALAAEAAPDSTSVASGDLLVNLILLGLAMFILLRFLTNRAKKKDSAQSAPPPQYDHTDDHAPPFDSPPTGKPNMYTNAQATWAALKSRPKSDAAGPAAPQGHPAAAAPDDEFLAGAKLAYSRINTALANRDYADLTHFVSPALLSQLKNTLPATPAGNPEFLLIEAALAGRGGDTGRTTMTVDYKALVREPGASQNTDRAERWTFSKENVAPGANWQLEGMEPL